MPNNADLGITLQRIICEKFNISLHTNAIMQFESNYNSQYATVISPTIDKIFKQIGHIPVECLTYTRSKSAKETLSPHNFVLDDGSTLSIRTNKKGDKVAPRVVGQCGIDTFNAHFSDVVGRCVSDKQEIKEVVFEYIDLLLPHFIDYLFVSDYTVWIHNLDNSIYKYDIIDRKSVVDLTFSREEFSFTRDLDLWTESTTLKYKGKSLAEIQIHKNRTFKFRFIMKSLKEFVIEEKRANETLGITAEKAVCDLFNIPVPEEYSGRWSTHLQEKVTPAITEAFKHIPGATESTGATKGERGKSSKCSYDFLLEGGKTLSLKTNTGKMVCPPEVGQPSPSTCYLYFGHLINEESFSDDLFKKTVLEKIGEMIPIYIEHLLDSDYLLWIVYKKSNFHYRIFEKNYANGFVWDNSKFSFSKPNIAEWNESNTLKYDGISIGEFQVHKSRHCYKFRFNLENLDAIISKSKIRE